MPGIKIRFYIVLSLIITILQFEIVCAQVFPGDADNNGVVNNLDVLNIGFAYGIYGPGRLETGDGSTPVNIPLLWDENFPQGLNFAFADANGNGVVDLFDLAIVSANYGETNAAGTEETTFFPGIASVHSPFVLDKTGVPDFLTSGSTVEIPIYLGNEDLPLDEFLGIAFTIEYDKDFISDIQFTLEADSWVNDGIGSFNFLAPEIDLGNKDITISRYGQSGVSGQGKIGTLSLIVIDDLVSLLPAPSDSSNIIISIKNIKSVNTDFWTIPIVSDSLSLMLYGPDAVPTGLNKLVLKQIKVFPNPSEDDFNIISPVPLKRVDLFNTFGQLLISQDPGGQNIWKIENLKNYAPGFYLMSIHTDKGVLNKKVLIQRD